MMLDPQKLQVLLDVLGRAPLTRAEQIIVQEVADQLIALAKAPTTETAPLNGAHEQTVEGEYR